MRFLLAAAVVALHIGPIFGMAMIGGDVAVQAFFMISGFYMSMVLSGKYSGLPVSRFYFNRLLKIYPSYLAVLAAVLMVGLIAKHALGRNALLQAYSNLGRR